MRPLYFLSHILTTNLPSFLWFDLSMPVGVGVGIASDCRDDRLFQKGDSIDRQDP